MQFAFITTRRIIGLGAVSALLLSGLLSGCSNGGPATTSTEGAVGGGAPAQGGGAPAQSGGEPARDGGERSSARANTTPGFNNAPEARAASGSPAATLGAADAAKPDAAKPDAAKPDAASPGAPVPGVGPKLTKSASLDLQVKEIAAAAARVRSIAEGIQAQVVSEQIGRGGPGDPIPLQDDNKQDERRSSAPGNLADLGGFGTLTLSVPADKLDTALDQLAKIGTVLGRNTSSEDVTSQYVDTESRLKTMRASVDRVRALMAQANDIGQVVALESEMSRRQADLESLESQLAALKTSVERSTVAVSLSTPATASEPVEANGFLAGLRSGWDAFTASASGLFRAFGGVLPFAIFFALIGAPLWWSWRRHLANRPAVVSTPAG